MTVRDLVLLSLWSLGVMAFGFALGNAFADVPPDITVVYEFAPASLPR